MEINSSETIKNKSKLLKSEYIDIGDIVFLTDDIKSEIDESKFQPTQVK